LADPDAAYPGRPLRVKEVDVAESEFDAVKKIGTAKGQVNRLVSSRNHRYSVNVDSPS
jgi:hypothetical protein